MGAINLKVWFSLLHPFQRMQMKALKNIFHATERREDLDNICFYAIKYGADSEQIAEFKKACIEKGFSK